MALLSDPNRRRFLKRSVIVAHTTALGAWAPGGALAALEDEARARRLAFSHLHTGERLDLVYARGDRLVPAAMPELNRFLRDHYSGEVGAMDPGLFHLLYRVRQVLDVQHPFQVISGYRSAQTNETLRTTRGGGVARRSLHMDGKAIDVRIAGVPLGDLRDAALSLKAGGVGFYPREQFVHLDTGSVRSW